MRGAPETKHVTRDLPPADPADHLRQRFDQILSRPRRGEANDGALADWREADRELSLEISRWKQTFEKTPPF